MPNELKQFVEHHAGKHTTHGRDVESMMKGDVRVITKHYRRTRDRAVGTYISKSQFGDVFDPKEHATSQRKTINAKRSLKESRRTAHYNKVRRLQYAMLVKPDSDLGSFEYTAMVAKNRELVKFKRLMKMEPDVVKKRVLLAYVKVISSWDVEHMMHTKKQVDLVHTELELRNLSVQLTNALLLNKFSYHAASKFFKASYGVTAHTVHRVMNFFAKDRLPRLSEKQQEKIRRKEMIDGFRRKNDPRAEKRKPRKTNARLNKEPETIVEHFDAIQGSFRDRQQLIADGVEQNPGPSLAERISTPISMWLTRNDDIPDYEDTRPGLFTYLSDRYEAGQSPSLYDANGRLIVQDCEATFDYTVTQHRKKWVISACVLSLGLILYKWSRQKPKDDYKHLTQDLLDLKTMDMTEVFTEGTYITHADQHDHEDWFEEPLWHDCNIETIVVSRILREWEDTAVARHVNEEIKLRYIADDRMLRRAEGMARMTDVTVSNGYRCSCGLFAAKDTREYRVSMAAFDEASKLVLIGVDYCVVQARLNALINDWKSLPIPDTSYFNDTVLLVNLVLKHRYALNQRPENYFQSHAFLSRGTGSQRARSAVKHRLRPLYKRSMWNLMSNGQLRYAQMRSWLRKVIKLCLQSFVLIAITRTMLLLLFRNELAQRCLHTLNLDVRVLHVLCAPTSKISVRL
jgi:hypothetical protein